MEVPRMKCSSKRMKAASALKDDDGAEDHGADEVFA